MLEVAVRYDALLVLHTVVFPTLNINKCLLPDWSPSTPIAVWAFDIVGALDVLYAAVVPLVDKSTSNKCINVYDNVTVWNTTR